MCVLRSWRASLGGGGYLPREEIAKHGALVQIGEQRLQVHTQGDGDVRHEVQQVNHPRNERYAHIGNSSWIKVLKWAVQSPNLGRVTEMAKSQRSGPYLHDDTK